MANAYHTTRRVEFRDTDAAGLMHFSAFFLKMEQVEHEFLRSIGESVVFHDEQGVISWPRAAVRCDYLGPAKFEDVLDVELHIGRLGIKSVSYAFRFSQNGKDIAKGEMTAVCCRIRPGEPPQSMSIPENLAAKLRPFVAP